MIVYSLSLGGYDVLRFNQRQAGEIWLTAAQSFLALALLVDLRLSLREALAMLGLFAVQFHPVFQTFDGLIAYSAVYVILGAGLLVARRKHLPRVVRLARGYAAGENVRSTGPAA